MREELSLRIRDMGSSIITDRSLLTEVSRRVQDLSVKDLNDLAAEFAGIKTTNPRVADLTVDDIRGIEAIFTQSKMDALAGMGGEVAGVDVSCCCCTPCCCCAVADTDPFEGTPMSAG